MLRVKLSAAMTQLMAKCLWSRWKQLKGYKEIASPFTCCPVNREYSWKKSQIKKSKLCFATCRDRLSVYGGWRKSWIFHDSGPYFTETSPFICRTNQWTGFHTTWTSVMKELMICYLHAFIEIHSLIMTK